MACSALVPLRAVLSYRNQQVELFTVEDKPLGIFVTEFLLKAQLQISPEKVATQLRLTLSDTSVYD